MARAGELGVVGGDEWPFSADDAYTDSEIFAELGCWAAGLDCVGRELLPIPPLDPPETTLPPPPSSVSVNGGASSWSTAESAADVKLAAAKVAASNPPLPERTSKSGQKRARQPRLTIITKSDIDHPGDGYRWRKYGQKTVKNCPLFPRSYYRCTYSKCTVKKRVERSSHDPSVVITNYEGQHCHPNVTFHLQPGPAGHMPLSAAHHPHLYRNKASDHHLPALQLPAASHHQNAALNLSDPLAMSLSSLLRPLHCNLQELSAATYRPLYSSSELTMPIPVVSVVQTQPSLPTSTPVAVDTGLLDDMVPLAMRRG